MTQRRVDLHVGCKSKWWSHCLQRKTQLLSVNVSNSFKQQNSSCQQHNFHSFLLDQLCLLVVGSLSLHDTCAAVWSCCWCCSWCVLPVNHSHLTEFVWCNNNVVIVVSTCLCAFNCVSDLLVCRSLWLLNPWGGGYTVYSLLWKYWNG